MSPPRRARALMVQGTASSAGKSLIATALARHLARGGRRVAPFKGLTMSNNARVVRGGEIGVAQHLQALAAGIEADVRMNPVLVKPEGDTRSQVVVMGRADLALGRLPWRDRAPRLAGRVDAALASLAAEHEVLVCEGAGSPAEINLMDVDLANMRVARAADAAVVLVADIDRGGAFAHLHGTWSLLAAEDRARVAGFVLNRFRGDPALLSPAPERLEAMTGMPLLGVVPMLRHGLPDEEGATATAPPGPDAPRVAIPRLPAGSNLDEFHALGQVAEVVWARRPGDLAGADLVVLPGSKHVAADLAWLRGAGLDAAIRRRAAEGGRVLGVCGGLQMLGGAIDDPHGVEGAGEGLGLLPLATMLDPRKIVRRVVTRLPRLDPPWDALSGASAPGYEIRHGRVRGAGRGRPAADDGGPVVVQRGPVLGVSPHGLLEDHGVIERLLGARPARTLDAALDALADDVMAGLDARRIDALADGALRAR